MLSAVEGIAFVDRYFDSRAALFDSLLWLLQGAFALLHPFGPEALHQDEPLDEFWQMHPDGTTSSSTSQEMSRPFSTADRCPHCPYQSFVMRNLEAHIRTHSQDAPFACMVCPYRSSQAGNLKTHMRKHTGERPFGCPVCPKNFGHHKTLHKHFNVHRDMPIIKCPHCTAWLTLMLYIKWRKLDFENEYRR